jgi:hypothetical protein
MKRLIIAVIVVLCFATSACADAHILKVIDGGKYLLLQVGPYKYLFEVLYGDNIDSALWFPMSECAVIKNGHPFYKIINLDDNESVEAKLLQ